MDKTMVSVSPKILRWVRGRSRLSVTALEKKVPGVRAWIKGKQPSLKQIEKLAKKTNTPLGYFFLTDPPEEALPIPYFRTVVNEKIESPSIELLETVYSMQQRQEWMREYLVAQGQELLPFVGSARITDNLHLVANKIRNTLGLGAEWAAQHKTWTEALRDLYRHIEDTDILVVASGTVGTNNWRPLDVNEFRGFVLHDEFAPLIFVNSADGKAAQMFTLAHEIAHIWFGSSAAFDLRELQPANDPTEQACNAVAAEVLVPENELRGIWQRIRNAEEPFQMAARHFKVSALVAARRALDLELITKGDFLDFYADYEKDERRKRRKREPGGDFWATQNLRIGRRFGSTIVYAAKEGRLSYKDAYRLTGLYGNTFDKYAQKVFGVS